MEKKYYILIGILIGWASYFVFPIEKPALTYFIGIFIGSISLFYIRQEKYTHNIWIQLALWAILIVLFPYYFVAGMAVGIGTHIGLDLMKKLVKGTQLGFYQQWMFTMFLILINSIVVVGTAIGKFLSY
ncbi:hypothetical protein AAGG74_17225 [Bacillus mexicanus]|uniref:hypothetical protein n=1 Tax=Bacillus mexicanus TaxID=2834415 RepID=UPI003D197816